MKPVDYIVIERTVRQQPPELYKADAEAAMQMNNLLENSNLSWADVDMVYQLCEHRQSMDYRKTKRTKVLGVYVQCKPGKMDYKYMHGLNFMIPIRNVHAEIKNFLEGGWNT